MSLSALAAVFAGNDQTGNARWYGVSASSRYRRVPRSMLSSAGLDAAISSVTVYASSSAETNLILFGLPGVPWAFLGDYIAGFHQVSNLHGADKPFDTNLSASGWNNSARSLLVVATRRRPEFRISFRDAFLSKWNDKLDGLLSGTEARRKGNPILTWEMFPSAVSYLDPNRIYLKIHQNLRIELSWWPNYDASVTYHIYLYVNSAKNLRGYVARWAYWVESGVKAKQIGNKIRPKVIQGMDEINSDLASSLTAFDGFDINSRYYLPGRQVGSTTSAQLGGWTTQDTTIVLEF
jgi:hypothetical protein